MSRLSDSAFRRGLLYWLAWTAAGLFYISQDFMTRLAYNESIAWRNIFAGWMGAMYICAAFTPLMLWLGRRWPVDGENRRRHIAFHLGLSVFFSLLFTAIEAPLLVAVKMLTG